MLLFVILVILACIILGAIVLIQNPKGGGLSGTIGGFSNQFMGVKQTTDILEKGTWIFAAIVGLLCIFSVMFIPTGKTREGIDTRGPRTQQTAPAPAQQAPAAKP